MCSKSNRNRSTKYSSEKGSVFFVLFFAIGLYAYLSFTATQSRQNTSSILRSTAKFELNKYRQFGAELSQALTRINALNGCPAANFSFYSPAWPSVTQQNNSDNPNAPEDKSCHVFDVAGGGLSLLKLNYETSLYTNAPGSTDSANYMIREIALGYTGSSVYGTSLADMVFIATNLTEDFCREINILVHGINTIPTSPTNTNVNIFFDGDFFEHPNNRIRSPSNSDYSQAPNNWLEGCAQSTVGDEPYFYFYPLFPR